MIIFYQHHDPIWGPPGGEVREVVAFHYGHLHVDENRTNIGEANAVDLATGKVLMNRSELLYDCKMPAWVHDPEQRAAKLLEFILSRP